MTEPTALPESWRLLHTPPADGITNMAVDLTLMDVAKSAGVGILRVYSWSRPTVSFGRNEQVTGIYDAQELTAAGLDFVRRPTGGRALLHAREVTYSVTLPVSDEVRWPSVYGAVNLRLLAAMQDLGVPAHIADETTPLTPHSADAAVATTSSHNQQVVCFSGIARGEIAVSDRKLVASSVWREKGTYLQHGSILIADDQSELSAVMGARIAPPAPGASLSEWLAPNTPTEAAMIAVELALNSAFAHCGKTERWSIPTEVRKQVDVTRLALAQSSWLWRR